MGFTEIWKSLEDVHLSGNKHHIINLFLAFNDVFHQGNPLLLYEQISKKVNFTLKGKFTLEEKRFIAKAIHVGDFYLFLSRFHESYISVFIILAMIGVVGNFSVLVYLLNLHKKNFRKMGSYHFLITVLAVLDIICCISTTTAYYFDWQIEWKLGKVACIVSLPLLVYALPNISFWVVGLLAYERYRNIVHPFARKLGIKVYCILLILITLLSTPSYYFGEMLENKRTFRAYNNIEYCQVHFLDVLPVGFCVGASGIVTMVILPAIINIVCVRRIFKYIKQNSMQVPKQNEENFNNNNITKTNSSKTRGNRNAFKILVLLVLIYILSVLPGRLYMFGWGYNYFITGEFNFDFDTRHYALLWISIVARILFLTNNVVNFLVYAYMMKGFRKFLISIVTLGILKKLRK